MPITKHTPAAILFDLDGTLVDTAPDLTYAINQVLLKRDYTALPESVARSFVSHGAMGLIQIGFEMGPDNPTYAELREEFLEIYQNNISRNSRLFGGMEEVLQHLEANNIAWGVATNKPYALADKLMQELNLSDRCATLVGGDSTDKAKPDPSTLFLACEQASLDPKQCWYVGDADRDIQAGQAAGMYSIGVRYGYTETPEVADTWGAEAVISQPKELLSLLEQLAQ